MFDLKNINYRNIIDVFEKWLFKKKVLYKYQLYDFVLFDFRFFVSKFSVYLGWSLYIENCWNIVSTFALSPPIWSHNYVGGIDWTMLNLTLNSRSMTKADFAYGFRIIKAHIFRRKVALACQTKKGNHELHFLSFLLSQAV